MITVLCVVGTGETWPGDVRTAVPGLLADLAAGLDPARFIAKQVPYPARYGAGESYIESRTRGEQNLLAATWRDPNPVIWVGYSQGAAVVGNAAAALPNNRHLDVRGIGLVADPARYRRQAFGPNPGGYGITGERFVDDALRPVWSLAAAGDPICALPEGSALRSIADATQFMSTDDPDGWVRDLLTRTRGEQWQRWWDRPNWREWGGAGGWAANYLVGGRHTRAYLEDGHIARLTAAINAVTE